jgi:mRNA interferase MazF
VTRQSVAQGDVWWADLGEPSGSGPAFRRPVVVVQGDAFNRSRLATVVCVPLTSNLKWAEAPGAVMLTERETSLPKASVANATQLVTVDRDTLTERVGKLPSRKLSLVLTAIDTVLGR